MDNVSQQLEVRQRQALRIVLPPSNDLVRPVRLAVGGLASLGDFTIESVEELQLAANELLVVLMSIAGTADLQLDLELVDDGAFSMTATAQRPDGAVDQELVSVSQRILSVMADDHRIDIGADVVSGFFVRHRDTWSDEGYEDLDSSH